jgi:uncharacterized DUF497 family protein
VSCAEAASVFSDPLARIVPDEDHSSEEPREIIIEHSTMNRLLLVCFKELETDRVRIISARRPQRLSSSIMKKTSRVSPKTKRTDGLRAEYRFDYTKAKLNRIAKRGRPGSLAVVLDPDVARVFKNSDSVNAVLRALVAAMPRRIGSADR